MLIVLAIGPLVIHIFEPSRMYESPSFVARSLDRRRIRSGLRLGQRKRRDLLAAAQIGQVLLADVLVAAQIDRHGADADVRADDRGEAGIDAAHLFHQDAVTGLARAHAAILARKRHAEQSDLRRFLDDVQRGLAGSIGLARGRAHFFFGKFADQSPQGLMFA